MNDNSICNKLLCYKIRSEEKGSHIRGGSTILGSGVRGRSQGSTDLGSGGSAEAFSDSGGRSCCIGVSMSGEQNLGRCRDASGSFWSVSFLSHADLVGTVCRSVLAIGMQNLVSGSGYLSFRVSVSGMKCLASGGRSC